MIIGHFTCLDNEYFYKGILFASSWFYLGILCKIVSNINGINSPWINSNIQTSASIPHLHPTIIPTRNQDSKENPLNPAKATPLAHHSSHQFTKNSLK